MAIILISKGSYSMGERVAQLVAERLGYRCLARELLLEAAEQFNVPEARLVHAISDSISILDRINGGRRRYVTQIRAALLGALARDNVVYHGFAGHLLVDGVSHALKVRVEAELTQRVVFAMMRDSISADAAYRLIASDDRERRRWSKHLYGVDIRDPSLFDVVLTVARISVEDAADIVCRLATSERFQTTAESTQRLHDLTLASQVECALLELTQDIEVQAESGHVRLKTLPQIARLTAPTAQLERVAAAVPGVTRVTVDAHLGAS